MADDDLCWRVEEACLNAWPALRQILLDGWVLRFGRGLTRRANSANPLRGKRRAVEALIADCEALYCRQQQPAIFRLPSLTGLDYEARLAAAGYTGEGESCVLYGDIDAMTARADPEVRLMARPSRDWFTGMARLQNHSVEQARTYRRIVGAVALPAAFAVLETEGEVAALAYGAIHDRLLCYESVVADTRRRRRGFARRVVTALAAWGRSQNAVGACLEVEATNAPALALYDAVGLKSELYRYHYRRAGSRPDVATE
ncbi:MAG TPA: GNAT family N-acetyltransferase [Stellaceae bacterium]|nr:GNAT family N-acetyltransferase [Stellaceae bacterium]